ncbi:heparan-alpha-glucosaminide N-acetyltransferase domain-containing protein [Lachnospiraceae bacterium 42-17]
MKLNYSTTNNAAAGRIKEIDVARGIAIISVIIGHLVWAEGFL